MVSERLKMKKLKLLNFLSTPWIENNRELISGIKKYEGVIDFKLIDVILFGTKM
jgi:hypothetical protein